MIHRPPLVLACLSVLIGFLAVTPAARAEIRLEDISGHTVALEKPARRVAVDDGRTIIAMSFLTDDPVGLIAAWPHDVDRFGRELYAAYSRKFPALESLPRVASNAQDLDVEQVLALHPDVFFVSTVTHASPAQLEQLREGGIAVIAIDFVTDPLENTDRSLAILGKATGHDAEAARIIALRDDVKGDIARRLQAADAASADKTVMRPKILLEPHASTQQPCCNSPGKAGLGRFLSTVGADNVGGVIGDRPSGKLALEQVIASAPSVYIATGGAYMKNRGGLLIGPEFSAEETRQSLTALTARESFSVLDFKPEAMHGISQQLFNSPLDILVLELLAKWARPDVFGAIDVEATRAALNRLMAVPLTGTYWTP